MAAITLDKALERADDWKKKGGEEHEKRTRIGAQLSDLGKAFKKLDQGLFDIARLKGSEEIEGRIDDLEAEVKKGSVRELMVAADALLASLKKFQPEFAKNAQTAKTLGPLAGEMLKAAQALSQQLHKAVEATQAALDKMLAAAEQAEEEAEKKGGAAVKPGAKLMAHNLRVKQLVGKLRAGKYPATLFAFTQANKKEPYAKGKPWNAKSLANVGPKANKSSRSVLAKLVGNEDFKFFFGEVRLETAEGKDKGKLIFMFESPLPNAKQFKDALMFQCGYCPKLQLRKNTGEVIDEAGEGEETDEVPPVVADEGGAAADTRLAALKTRHEALKPAMARVRAQGGELAATLDKADKQIAKLLEAQQYAEADTLLKALDAKLGAAAKAGAAAPGAKPTSVPPATPTAAQGDAAPAADARADAKLQRIETARSAWATARDNAEKGFDALIGQITAMYREDPDQKALADAIAKLRALVQPLRNQVFESRLAEALAIKDPAQRDARLKTFKAPLTALVGVVAQGGLMAEIDHNEVIPDLEVVAPMKTSLRELVAALG